MALRHFIQLDQRVPSTFNLRGHFTKSWQLAGHFQQNDV